MTDPGEALAAARDAAHQGNWPEALAAFEALPEGCPLGSGDLAAWADAAWWLGRVDECIAAYDRAFHGYLDAGLPRDAAMTALGIAANFFLRGDVTGGSAWLGRSADLLAGEPDCPELGYLVYLTEVEGALDGPDPDAAAAARRVRDMGRRLADPNLVAIGLLGEGRCLLRQGDVRGGMALLDESMVLVLGGEVQPDWAGNVYCHLMSACHELADLRRARFWVEATARWLATLPAAVLFTGICRVHRSQVLQATGDWPASEREAARVCADLVDIAGAAAAEGYYQLGELARLRGELGAAQDAYERAHHLGRDPQPGLALLRAAQGRPDAGAASLRTALLVVTANPLARARIRCAQAEIALLLGDLPTAHDAIEELERVATSHDSPGFTAAARHWRGALLLARGLAPEAVPCLHDACAAWRDLQAPYDCARARVVLADAYRRMGDADGAELELSAAAEVFDRLGAAPDAAAVALRRGTVLRPGGLTDRELEVLGLLAGGASNREISQGLVISGKTVARHLSNIFTKLDVGTRTAAAAWAHHHDVGRPTHSAPAPNGSNAR